jgi:hypothetical protein
MSTTGRGNLTDGKGAPPITAPLLFARSREPSAAFEKFDGKKTGVVSNFVSSS